LQVIYLAILGTNSFHPFSILKSKYLRIYLDR